MYIVNKSIEKERNIVFRNKAPGKMHKINYCRSIDMQCILIGRLQLVLWKRFLHCNLFNGPICPSRSTQVPEGSVFGKHTLRHHKTVLIMSHPKNILEKMEINSEIMFQIVYQKDYYLCSLNMYILIYLWIITALRRYNLN